MFVFFIRVFQKKIDVRRIEKEILRFLRSHAEVLIPQYLQKFTVMSGSSNVVVGHTNALISINIYLYA